jgi:hypothetical protein
VRVRERPCQRCACGAGGFDVSAGGRLSAVSVEEQRRLRATGDGGLAVGHPYFESPTAAKASSRVGNQTTRAIFPSWMVQTAYCFNSTCAPLALPRPR